MFSKRCAVNGGFRDSHSNFSGNAVLRARPVSAARLPTVEAGLLPGALVYQRIAHIPSKWIGSPNRIYRAAHAAVLGRQSASRNTQSETRERI